MTKMIDWVSCSIPYRSAIVQDAYYVIEHREGELKPSWTKGVQVEGSFASGLMVQATGSTMYLSGNPVKFLTGQNVVGISCLATLIRETYKAVITHLGIPDCIDSRRALKAGLIKLTRVDCTFAYNIGSDEDVQAWLLAMEQCCSVRYRGRGQYNASMASLYFGLGLSDEGKLKGSRRSTFKFYNKRRELAAHPMTCPPQFQPRLLDYATGIVRGEATFRGQELKRLGLQLLAGWNGSTAYELHKLWIGKMDIQPSVRLADEDELELPRKLRAVYLLWRQGEDMREMLPKTTYYRQRSQLLDHGIDIGVPCRDAPERETFVPVISVLEADPVDETDQEELFWEIFEMRRVS